MTPPRWTVLVTAPYMLPVIERFSPFFAEHGIALRLAAVEERLEEDALLPLMAGIDGVICGDDRFTANVIAAAPALKVIVKWGTGIDSIDAEATARRGIRVCRTPGAFTEPVADSVIGYVLAFARRLSWMDRAMKRGQWQKIPGRALDECTLGVVGVGAIGSAVLRRAGAFGMTLLGTDVRAIDAEHTQALGVTMVPLTALLEGADFVSLHCDLNATSRRLFDAEALARMKEGAVLINTARGPVVDEGALVAALRAGRLGGAALDVYEDEPLPAASPLRAFDNVMLAPHNSNSSPRAWESVHRNTLAMLLDGLEAGA